MCDPLCVSTWGTVCLHVPWVAITYLQVQVPEELYPFLTNELLLPGCHGYRTCTCRYITDRTYLKWELLALKPPAKPCYM